MEFDPKELVTFVALVMKHEKMLDGASHILYGQSQLLESMLPKCSICDAAPLTTRHRRTGVGACERCVAEEVVKTSTFVVTSKRIDDWVDVDRADEIRQLIEYVNIIRTLDPPVNLQ